MQRVTVKLEIPVKINFNEIGSTKEDFSKHLSLCITDEQSDRPSFNVELLLHGFIRLIWLSIKNAIEEVQQKKYPREYIETKTGSITSDTPKWCVTSLPFISKIRLDIIRAFKGSVL